MLRGQRDYAWFVHWLTSTAQAQYSDEGLKVSMLVCSTGSDQVFASLFSCMFVLVFITLFIAWVSVLLQARITGATVRSDKGASRA